MKKRIIQTGILLMLLLMVWGCGNDSKENGYQVFYLNMDVTKIIPCSLEMEETEDGEALAMTLLEALQSEPDSSELRQTLSDNVSVKSCIINGYMLTVDFSSEYYSMNPTEEILVRAAIVRTLMQVEGISYVTFTVDAEPLIDTKGNIVGSMDADNFVENPGEQINSSLRTTLTLYFASEDGTQLVKETRVVHYSSNISLEKLVVEQLIEGPKTSGLQATIPSGTKLITITVVDGVCYVNLDETFRNQKSEVTEQAVLFSIVNSLSELPDVNKVQISVNGDTKGKCRFTYDLSTMYEEDDSIVREDGETAEPENTEITE